MNCSRLQKKPSSKNSFGTLKRVRSISKEHFTEIFRTLIRSISYLSVDPKKIQTVAVLERSMIDAAACFIMHKKFHTVEPEAYLTILPCLKSSYLIEIMQHINDCKILSKTASHTLGKMIYEMGKSGNEALLNLINTGRSNDWKWELAQILQTAESIAKSEERYDLQIFFVIEQRRNIDELPLAIKSKALFQSMEMYSYHIFEHLLRNGISNQMDETARLEILSTIVKTNFSTFFDLLAKHNFWTPLKLTQEFKENLVKDLVEKHNLNIIDSLEKAQMLEDIDRTLLIDSFEFMAMYCSEPWVAHSRFTIPFVYRDDISYQPSTYWTKMLMASIGAPETFKKLLATDGISFSNRQMVDILKESLRQEKHELVIFVLQNISRESQLKILEEAKKNNTINLVRFISKYSSTTV